MIFKAKPAKLMATWTSHMRTSWYSLNRNLTFWTFVSKKNKIYEPKNWFQCEALCCGQRSKAFWTFMICIPFAFWCCVYEITVLRRTFSNIFCERGILFKKIFLKFFFMLFIQSVQCNTNINFILRFERWNYTWSDIIGDFLYVSFDMHVPALVTS